MSINISESEIKEKIFDDFAKDVKAVKETPVNGLIKLWLYQHGIIYRLTWPFLIHDLDLTKSPQQHIQPLLKKWSGIGRSVDTGMLYRTPEEPWRASDRSRRLLQCNTNSQNTAPPWVGRRNCGVDFWWVDNLVSSQFNEQSSVRGFA